tara:strand:- start:73 stop:1746 length:1674 start_codon:yes stop_codon:yes gene_type:complete
MKELNLLVENYFTPALDATDILRLVEQIMNEEIYYKDPEGLLKGPISSIGKVADDIIKFVKRKFPPTEDEHGNTVDGYQGADLRYVKGANVLVFTNFGSLEKRHAAIEALVTAGYLSVSADKSSANKEIKRGEMYYRATTNFVNISKNGKDTPIIVVFEEGVSAGRLSNKGDIAEGIMGAAMAAAFIAGGKPIDVQRVKEILKQLSKKKDTSDSETKISKSMTIKETREDGTIDTITCTVKLQRGHFDNLMNPDKWELLDGIFRAVVAYANDEETLEATRAIATNGENNEVVVLSDGIGNQKGTKIDVSIFLDGEKTSLGKISLKAGSTDTLGQVGGSWEGMSFMFGKMFGIELDSKLKEDWEKAMAEKPRDLSKIVTKAAAIYKDAEGKIRGKLNPKGGDAEAELDMLKHIANGMKYQVALDEKGVILIHLKDGDFDVLDFALLEEALIENKIKLTSELSESIRPTIKIIAQPGTTDDDGAKFEEGDLFTVRWRQADDGKMVKNYVEKKPYMVKLLKDLRKKKRAETLRMRHLQSISSTRHGATHLREKKEIDSNK